MFKLGKRSSIESFLVIILFIIFSSAIAVILLEGAKTFDKIALEKESAENFRIASSYINMVIVQNDIADHIAVVTNFLDTQTALVVRHGGDEAGFATYIYHKAGYLWELYLAEEEEPSHELATKIVAVDGVCFSHNLTENHIAIDYIYKLSADSANIRQNIALETR